MCRVMNETCEAWLVCYVYFAKSKNYITRIALLSAHILKEWNDTQSSLWWSVHLWVLACSSFDF